MPMYMHLIFQDTHEKIGCAVVEQICQSFPRQNFVITNLSKFRPTRILHYGVLFSLLLL